MATARQACPLFAPAGDDQQRVVDRDPQADERDEEGDDLAHRGDRGQPEYQQECGEDGHRRDDQGQQGEQAGEDEQEHGERAEPAEHGGGQHASSLLLRPWLRYLPATEITELRRARPQARPPAVIVDSVCCRPGRESLVGTLLRDAFLQFRRLEPGFVLAIAWAHGATAAIAEQMRWQALGPFGRTDPDEAPITLYIQRDWAAGFDAYVERLLGLRPDPVGVDAMPAAELHDAVKVALENLYDLTELRHSPLTRLRRLQSATDPPATLRDLLMDAIRDLESFPSGQQREAGALLRDIYIRRLASHEIVAQRLGLPRTTYYRRLRQGIQALATWLRTQDAGAVRVRPDTDTAGRSD